MFRKILFLLIVFTSFGSQAQETDPCTEVTEPCVGVDVECYDIWFPNQEEYYADVKSGANQYLVCKDQKVTVTPNFMVNYLNETDRYTVEKIDYEENVYPFRDGTEIIVRTDARADVDIDLPFEFSFFGRKWQKVNVHSNGVVNFTDGTLFKGAVSDQIPPGANCPLPNGCYATDPLNPLPKGGPGSMGGAGWLNSISAPAFHNHVTTGENGTSPAGTDPATGETWPYSKISYKVYGEAPCRVLVINFANMPIYNLHADVCAALSTNSLNSQVVLHETTNVIDVNVETHFGCPLYASGRSIIGINNDTGTVAYTAPGRNAEHFDIDHPRLGNGESWRFGPAGDPRWSTEWYVNEIFQSESEGLFSYTVEEVNDVTSICAVLTLDDVGVDQAGVVFRPDINLEGLEVERQLVCDNEQEEYDLLTLNQIVIDYQDGCTADQLKFFYYNNEDDAENKENRIDSPSQFPIEKGENKVWMRVEGRLPDCFEIVPITILKEPAEVLSKKDIAICEEYTLPVLTNGEFYYKMERLDEDAKYVVETFPDVSEKQLINKAGYYRVYVKKINEYDCEDVKSFMLLVESCSYPKGISPNFDGDNDYLDLTYNNVQELKIYNRYGKLVYEHGKGYKRQWQGQDMNDKMLPSGTYFLYVKTLNYEYQDWIQLVREVK